MDGTRTVRKYCTADQEEGEGKEHLHSSGQIKLD